LATILKKSSSAIFRLMSGPSRKTPLSGRPAGKQPSSKLLMRFYDVSGGANRIDGIDIASFRAQTCFLSLARFLQDTQLFNDRSGTTSVTSGPMHMEEVVARARQPIRSFHPTLPNGMTWF
jgi:ATP-binding cassette subfamily B protein